MSRQWHCRVLAYEHLRIDVGTQHTIISDLQEFGKLIDPRESSIPMEDETDRIFYDTAKASGAVLVTGNIKHYPDEPFIMTPAEFLKRHRM